MTLSKDNSQSYIKHWAALLLSPITWVTCFTLIYVLDEMICSLNLFRSLMGGRVTAVIPIMLFLTLITFLVTVANAYLGWQIWRKAQQTKDGQEDGRDRFIGLAGIMSGGLFAILTLGLAASILILDPC